MTGLSPQRDCGSEGVKSYTVCCATTAVVVVLLCRNLETTHNLYLSRDEESALVVLDVDA